MTKVRREIFVNLLKATANNIRYEKHALRQHREKDDDQFYQCPVSEHERDMRLFRDMHMAALKGFMRGR